MIYPYPSRRMTVWLNGISLTAAAPLVIIRNVFEDNPETDLLTGERPGRAGMRVLSNKRTQLTVRVEFVIREIHDLQTRAETLQAVNAWAQDGILELSNRPGKYLRCIVSKRAGLGAMRDYTQTYSLEFSAISCPYWQAVTMDSVSASGTTGTATIAPSGTCSRIPLEFRISPTADTLTSCSITVNGMTMSFSGLTIAAPAALSLTYNADMIQLIMAGSASAIGNRTADSADDLLVIPGQNNDISWVADVSADVQFAARGLYL